MKPQECCVLIPSLSPDDRLPAYVKELLAAEFGLILVVDDGSALSLGAYCGDEAQAAGKKAGDLIRTLAPIVGGKGGGKADMARGSGKNREAAAELISEAQKALA